MSDGIRMTEVETDFSTVVLHTSRMRNQKSCCFDRDLPIGDEGVDDVLGVGGADPFCLE